MCIPFSATFKSIIDTAMPDPTSQSNYIQIATERISFVWDVDFQLKIIRGFAVHDLIVKQGDVREVVWADQCRAMNSDWTVKIPRFDTADLDVETAEVHEQTVAVCLLGRLPSTNDILNTCAMFNLVWGYAQTSRDGLRSSYSFALGPGVWVLN